MIVSSMHKLMPVLAVVLNSATSQITLKESVPSACSKDQYFDSTALKCSECPRTPTNVQLLPQTDCKLLASSSLVAVLPAKSWLAHFANISFIRDGMRMPTWLQADGEPGGRVFPGVSGLPSLASCLR